MIQSSELIQFGTEANVTMPLFYFWIELLDEGIYTDRES